MTPLPYHRQVADALQREHPASFGSLLPGARTGTDDLDQALLRSTYRLEPGAHPDVHAAVDRAAAALALTLPVEIYANEGGDGANAELVFVPDRAILLFTGSILELLDPDELCAVGGHELAHHLLWTTEGGRYLAAARLLDAAESDARTPSVYLETARRFRLATELYADRAALVASGSLAAAVSGLLKVSTGLRQVDPEAYLRQAGEVDLGTGSARTTHPETVLRAWALQQWEGHELREEDTAEVETRVARAVAASLDLESIDLPGQDRLAAITRALVQSVIGVPALQEPGVLELAEQYGVDVPAYPVDPATVVPEDLAPATRTYLAAVLADLATAHDEAGLEALAQVLGVATRAGLAKELRTLVTRELGLADRERVRLDERALAIAGGAE